MVGFGHASSMEQPIVTTRLACSIISGVRVFGWLFEMSMLRSCIAWTTLGLILWDRMVPALWAFSPCFLAKASAIWLRPAFSTQTNSTGPLAKLGSLHESEDKPSN